MNSYNAAVLSHLTRYDKTSITDLPPGNKLSETKAFGALCTSLSCEVETLMTVDETQQGVKRKFEIKDKNGCGECSKLKPIDRPRCSRCRGLGFTESKRCIEVDLSAGVFLGQTIRFSGLGGYDSRSGKTGDLIVRIKAA